MGLGRGISRASSWDARPPLRLLSKTVCKNEAQLT